MFSRVSLVVAIALSAYCTPTAAQAKPAPPEAWWSADAATQQLLEVDRAFAAMSIREGARAAFARYGARNVVSLPANRPITNDLDGLLAGLGSMADAVMTWQVDHAEVTPGGEQGLTWGSGSCIGPSPMGRFRANR